MGGQVAPHQRRMAICLWSTVTPVEVSEPEPTAEQAAEPEPEPEPEPVTVVDSVGVAEEEMRDEEGQAPTDEAGGQVDLIGSKYCYG